MEKILVSACLLGDKVRYDGGSNPVTFLDELSKHFEIVPFCPEVQGGLPTPRDPAEIVGSLVMTKAGKDVTANYNDGAQKALTLCKFFGIRYAILKDGSPACGPRQIHDGKFDGIKIDGLGVTARLLVANGIKVYAETDNISFLWNKPTERKIDQPKRKKRRFDNRPRTLAEANAEEAAEKLARENGTLADDEATPTGEGKPSYEHRGYGHSSYGHSSYGHSSYGHGGYHHDGEGHSFGHKPYGEGGHSSYGHKPYGNSHSYGHKPYGEKTEGAEGTSFEKKPYEGHSSYGHKPYGEGHSSYGHKPYGEGGHSSYGHKPYGEGHSFGHKPYGEGGHSSYGHKPYGHKPYGEKTEGAEGAAFEKKPYEGHSSYGHKPYGEGGHSSYGHKNYGHSSYGHKPEGEGHSFGHKPYGEGHGGHGYGHSSYGRKPYNKNYSHKSYNDHRSGEHAPVAAPKGDEKK